MNGYRKFTGALFKVNDVISKVELLLMSISMVILTAVMSWQVLTRYFIGIPATWAEELCRYLFIWTSFVGSAYAVWMSEHIEIDLIDNVIKAKFKDAEKVLAGLKKIVLLVIIVFSLYFLNLYYGYGNVINVKRTVEEYELAGVAGIQLEDQSWPKRCGHMEGKVLISAEEMVQKIRIAVASRKDPDFVIVARTDANTVLGFDEAIRRSNLYAEAGADIIFFESPTSDEQVEKIPDLVHAPVMLNMSEGAKTPLRNNAEIRSLGYKLVIWPSSATWAAARAIQEIYQILKDKGTTGEDLEKLILFHEFNDLIGLPEVMRLSDEYKTGTTY